MNNVFEKYDMHLYRDSFQNYKVYQIPKAQLIIADVPYNLGTNAYGSNPSWYVDGDNKNGESDKAQALQEFAQCGAVILRIMEKIEKE